MENQPPNPEPALDPNAHEPSPRWPPPVPDPSPPTRSPLPNLSVLGIGLAFDPGASHLDPFFDPHCAMSRRDIEQDLSVVPFAAVPDLMSFDLRRVFKAVPLDEQVLRSFALDSFPERRAAIIMLRGREVMMRRTEAVVFDLGLPRPQDSSILEWMPDGHIIGTEPMALRWRLIRKEMLKYNTFPWVELDGVNTGFIRPELYVIEAFNLSSLYMRQIYATIKTVAECYPQRGPVKQVQVVISLTTGRFANNMENAVTDAHRAQSYA